MCRRVLPMLLAAVRAAERLRRRAEESAAENGSERKCPDSPLTCPVKEDMRLRTPRKTSSILRAAAFWGMEHLMQSIPGVLDAESGYANGTCEEDADYQTVCKGDTGFRETVRVEYDPEQVSLDALLLAYFYVIDPTVENRQGNDVGQPVPDRRLLHQRQQPEETVERIAADRAGPQREVLRGDRSC